MKKNLNNFIFIKIKFNKINSNTKLNLFNLKIILFKLNFKNIFL